MLTLLGNYSVVNKLNVSTEKVKKKKENSYGRGKTRLLGLIMVVME